MGLFYYYFANKEELFGQLLPDLGAEMIAFISERTAHLPHDLEREVARFESYFEFLATKPEFNRVFTEAQVFVPNAYAAHMNRVMTNYLAALEQHRKAGTLPIKMGALKPLAYALIGIRNYMTQLVASRDPTFRSSPAELTDLYRMLLLQGVFRK